MPRCVQARSSAGRVTRGVVPSLERASVEAWGEARREAQLATERKLAEQAARSIRPPDDGDVWLPSTTVALVLGISKTRVDQLARAERLPYTRRGVRRWFRRSHVEQIAAARALRFANLNMPTPGQSC